MNTEEITLQQPIQTESIIIIDSLNNPNTETIETNEINIINEPTEINIINETIEINIQDNQYNQLNPETNTETNKQKLQNLFTKITNAKFVSEEGLDNLKYYKYSGEDKSLLVKYCLAPFFWNPLVKKLPLWLAPNLITLFGGLCMLLALFAVQFTMEPQDTPSLIVNIFCSLMIFLYQTADNLDGKQARRTQSSSALGELFDHGVDAIMVGIFGMIISMNMQLSCCEILSMFLVLNIVFYLSHWEEYYVGTLVLGYIVNPTELQYMTIFYLLFQALFPEIGTFSIMSFMINEYCFFIMIILSFFTIVSYIWGIYRWSRNNNKSFSECLSKLTQYTMFIIFSFALVFCINNALEKTFVFWTITYIIIIVNAYLTQRLVVKRICKEDVPLSDPILIVYVVFVIILSYFGMTNNLVMIVISSLVLLCIVFGFEVALVKDICNAFCERLGIRVFKIKVPENNEN